MNFQIGDVVQITHETATHNGWHRWRPVLMTVVDADAYNVRGAVDREIDRFAVGSIATFRPEQLEHAHATSRSTWT